MSASYPASIKQFTRKRDLLDIVLAADINQVYDEVTSIEQRLGTFPATNIGYDQGDYDQSTLVWDTLRERIQNIDYGLNEAFNNRVQSSGGTTILPSSTTTVGLNVKAAAGQSANLFEARTSSNTITFSINASGTAVVSNSPVVSEDGTQTLKNKTMSGSSNSFSNIPSSAVTVVEGNNIRQYVDSRPTIIYSPTEPVGMLPGTLWVDSSENVDPFDASGLLLKEDPSVLPSEDGFRRIYSSTSAPTVSDGNNGDLWLQYVN